MDQEDKRAVLIYVKFVLVVGALVVAGMLYFKHMPKPVTAAGDPTDDYIRHQIVFLIGDHGTCTGVRVRALSGTLYTVTASHCAKAILDDQNETVSFSENGVQGHLSLVAADLDNDLMLLTASTDIGGVVLAHHIAAHERVHTIAHGDSRPSYRTYGEFVCTADRTSTNCVSQYFEAINSPGQHPFICTNAAILPGASGGALLNEKNELIGILLGIDNKGFSYSASLNDVRNLLAGH